MKLLNLDSFYSVMLHNRCNFHCSYCCAEGRKSTHLSHIESNFDRLAELFSMSEPGLIALSGGEPGLTKNIHDFIKGQTRHKFMVFSNASYMPEWFYEDNIKFVIATFHEECISKEKFFENVKRFYDSGKKVIVKIIVKPHLRSLDKELWGKAWEHGIPAHFTPLEYTYWFHDSLLEDIKSSLTSCLYNARFFRSALTCGSSTRCRGGTDKMFEVSADGVISRCSFIHNTDNGNLEVPSFYESARPCAFKNCDCEWHYWSCSAKAEENARWSEYIENGVWRKPGKDEFFGYIEKMNWLADGRNKAYGAALKTSRSPGAIRLNITDGAAIDIAAYDKKKIPEYVYGEAGSREWSTWHIKPDWTILDIFPPTGTSSVIFGALAPRGHVYAFSGAKDVEGIAANAKYNYLTNITAAEAKDVNIDEILRNNRADGIGLIKIGPGARVLDILNSAAGTLEKFDPFIIIGVRDSALANSGHSHKDIVEWLTAKGYSKGLLLDGEDLVVKKDLTAFDKHYQAQLATLSANLTFAPRMATIWNNIGTGSVKRSDLSGALEAFAAAHSIDNADPVIAENYNALLNHIKKRHTLENRA